jgi:sec-independent protein translocase protein TatC
VKDIDDSKAPLLEHLIELRRRLLWSLGVLGGLFLVCIYFARPIFAFLVQPLLRAGEGRLIYTDIFEAFFVEVKVALFAALMLGFPFFAMQIWKFVAPGLYAKEKKALLPFLLLTPLFFVSGAAFAYYVAMPWALHFLLSYQGNIGGINQEALPGVGNYLTFCTRFLFGFGVAFLTPILLMILERTGLITLQQLTKYRRYAIVAAAAAAAVLTPPDAVSMLLLLVPLYSLYELAILAIRVTHWRAARAVGANSSALAEKSEGPEAPPGGGSKRSLSTPHNAPCFAAVPERRNFFRAVPKRPLSEAGIPAVRRCNGRACGRELIAIVSPGHR